jgi:hypothetical protein
MAIDINKVKTQDSLDEPSPIEKVDARVEAEMKILEGKAKRDVAEGLGNKPLAAEGEKLEQEGERDLEKTK